MKKTLQRALFFCSVLALAGVLVLAGCPNEVEKSNEKNITGFSIGNAAGAVKTDEISVIVPAGTNLASLSPTIKISEGASVTPKSEEENDFTNPTTYVVKAENGTTKSYVVTVTVKVDPSTILNSITILSSPYKTSYAVGEALDLAGLTVRGSYGDGSTKIETVTAENISNYDSSKAGSQAVVVTIDGRTTSFSVTVTNTSSLILTVGLVPGGNNNLEIYGVPASGIKLSVGKKNGLPDSIVISAGGISGNAVYDDVTWYVNNTQTYYSNNIITINAGNYAFTKPHTITMVATKLDGSRHSKTITFTVEP